MIKLWKWFWAWDYEEEERWLNRLSQSGLQLVSVGVGSYLFREGEKGEFIYRLEMLERSPLSAKSQEYLSFLADAGIEHVASIVRWVYLRKRASDGPFDIYSDIDSKIRHFNRILLLVAALGAPNLLISIQNFVLFLLNDLSVSFFAAGLNFTVAVLLTVGAVKIHARVRALKRERAIRE